MGGVAWNKEEDQLLKKCIEQYGEGKWHRIPLLAGLNRCRKSCRLRWLNYLRPNIKRGSFEREEIELIVKLHGLLGNRWSLIAGRLPGRTANDVKNYWNCHLSKRLNAQVREVKQTTKDVQVSLQPRNLVATSIMPRSPESGPSLQPPQGQTDTSTSMQHLEVGKGGQMLQKEGNNNYGGPEEHGFDSDLGMDFEFEEVKVTCGDENIRSSQWDWDDLILDMDLWNESL